MDQTYRGRPLSDPPLESGVQSLIDRLRSEGLESGQKQAQSILDDAHAKARRIVAEAQQEAETIRQQAREEAARTQSVGQEALRLAARDVLLSLKNQITGLFREVLGRQVTAQFNREDFLRDLLLQVCQRELQMVIPATATQENDSTVGMTVLLPDKSINLESLKQAPESVQEGSLAHLVLNLCQDGLRQGVEFANTGEKFRGFKVWVESEQVVVDLTDQAAAALLLQYLLPRFRAVLEGYI